MSNPFQTASAEGQGLAWVYSLGDGKNSPKNNEGWFVLTRAPGNPETSSCQLLNPVEPTGKVLKLEFDYISWGGNGADGLSLYLFDAAAANAGTNGFWGNGLGYFNLVGAYVGIGLDEYGGFLHRIGTLSTVEPLAPHSVSIRGSQERKYELVGNFPLKTPLCYNAPEYTTRQQVIDAGGLKHVVAEFTPKKAAPGYTIKFSINGELVIEGADYPYPAPASMKVGLSASTGYLTGNHEFRNLQFQMTAPVETEQPPVSLVRNIPAYISTTSKLFAYPQLNDGDLVHQGWDGSGKWGDQLTGPLLYGLDLTGTPCQDSDGPCGAPPGKGAVDMNTVVVYSRQDDGARVVPSDSTVFTQHGAINFRIEAQKDGSNEWIVLARVTGNNLVKRTVTFETQRFSRFQVIVEQAASSGPSIVEIEAF